MASLGQLTAGIAHEINNPVNFISGNLHPLREDLKDLLDMLALYEQTVQQQGFEAQFHEAMALRKRIDLDTVREEISELMNGIEEGASRTTEIVQGLRTFARMDGGEPQGFNLHQGLDSTLALLKNQMTNIEVIRDYGDLPELEGFPGRINQVMMNLFTNAVQAMPEGGWLRIKTAVEDDKSVSIAIQDTGKGMSEDIRQRIFEPFFTTKDVGEGTGLGLAISLGIVQQHGGNILIESQPGHGTLVVVRLPIRQAVKSSMS
ncbi:MAG: ATP-binding protein [Bacteroidia bacterium]|nr:ATP-binding protein [Bacteroidia bacterium]